MPLIYMCGSLICWKSLIVQGFLVLIILYVYADIGIVGICRSLFRKISFSSGDSFFRHVSLTLTRMYHVSHQDISPTAIQIGKNNNLYTFIQVKRAGRCIKLWEIHANVIVAVPPPR